MAQIRRILTACLITSGLASLHGQAPIGFREPRHTRPLTDYRLPSWGSSTLVLDLSTEGNRTSSEDQNKELTTNDFDFDFTCNPRWWRFHTSEESVTSYGINLEFLRDSWDWEAQSPHGKSTASSTELLFRYFLGASVSRYFKANAFWHGSGEVKGISNRYRYRRRGNGDSKRDLDRLNYTYRIGIGVGRVREVTPVIRALRFKERLEAFGKGFTLGDEAVQRLAHQMALYPGYYGVYDRESKYFWSPLFEALPELATGLSPFEYHSLMDVMAEDVRDRREGWDLTFGLQYMALSLKRTEKDGSAQQMRRDDQYWGPVIRTRYYHNPTLTQQLSLLATVFYGASASRNPEKNQQGYLDLAAGYLYNLTDRFILSPSGSLIVFFDRKQPTDLFSTRSDAERQFFLQLNATYYIENDLSLTHQIRWTRTEFKKWSRSDIDFIFSITYYLDRRLFK